METKFNKLNEVIEYIENHLEDDIDMQDLANIMGCSQFDFLRIFTFLCDISPSTYIRRRRMSLAAEALQKGYRVIDVALKYGYLNPVSFSRTFKEQFCILPREIKDSSFSIKMFPKLELSIIKREDFKMNARIVAATKTCCFIGIGKTVKDKTFNLIPKFWNQIKDNGVYTALERFSIEFPFDKEYYEQNGINLCNIHGIGISEKDGKEKYVIGTFSDKSNEEKYERYFIPACDYLVISGDYDFNKTWQNVQDWLSQSIYKRDKKHSYIELYAQTTDGNDYAEIWVPIVKDTIQIKNPDDVKSKNKESEFVLLPEFKFIGKTLHIGEKKSSSISEFWRAFNSDERNNELLNLPRLFEGCKTFSGISIVGNACKEKGQFLYAIGVFSPINTLVPNGYDVYNFPSTLAAYGVLGTTKQNDLREIVAANNMLNEDGWAGELYYCDEPLIENDKTLFHWLLPVKKTL